MLPVAGLGWREANPGRLAPHSGRSTSQRELLKADNRLSTEHQKWDFLPTVGFAGTLATNCLVWGGKRTGSLNKGLVESRHATFESTKRRSLRVRFMSSFWCGSRLALAHSLKP
jgi:hypothetical protein